MRLNLARQPACVKRIHLLPTRFVTRCAAFLVAGATLFATSAAGQEPTSDQTPAEHHHPAPIGDVGVWRWTADANVFSGYNDQVAQLFQTGESYNRTPLVNLHPQVPLAHHFMDSTHISTGVVRGGVSRGAITLEASAFRGAEPDENRTSIERPALDSWAIRGRYDAGHWHAQLSTGHLKQPEWYEPYDLTRVTAVLRRLQFVSRVSALAAKCPDRPRPLTAIRRTSPQGR